MLEPTRPYGEPALPYLSRMLTFQVATEPWQLVAYRGLRTQVFCREQRLFASADDERDVYDAGAIPIVALDHMGGNPDHVVGVVRIYEADRPGLFYGGRLAVERAYRKQRAVGAGLIRKAVSTAHFLGCTRFLATVQADNAEYFRRYHFAPLAPVSVCDTPHWLMQADLRAYPPEPPGHASLAA